MVYLGYIAAFLTTASFIPQAIKTFKTKDTESISLLMYSMFVLGVAMWLIYGLLIGDMPLVIANVFTFAFSSPILMMKIRNRKYE